MLRQIIGVGVYLIALFALGWLDYWWFVSFALLSPVVSTIFAFRDTEYWPAVHPEYGFFWATPAIVLTYGMVMNHPAQWGQWLSWSALIAAGITAIWTVKLRRWIDREWAVFGTLSLVFVFVTYALGVLNAALPWQQWRSELAAVERSSPGGYRRPPYLVVSTQSREGEWFFPGWTGYFDIGSRDAVCVRRYSGGLGWEWSSLTTCTEEEIERAVAD